jgi:hypothetical protein
MKVDNFWQPVVFYNLPIKVRFHQERQTFPFFCDKIFTDEKEKNGHVAKRLEI